MAPIYFDPSHFSHFHSRPLKWYVSQGSPTSLSPEHLYTIFSPHFHRCSVRDHYWPLGRSSHDSEQNYSTLPTRSQGLPILGNALDIDVNEPTTSYTPSGEKPMVCTSDQLLASSLHAYICEGDVYSRTLVRDFVIGTQKGSHEFWSSNGPPTIRIDHTHQYIECELHLHNKYC